MLPNKFIISIGPVLFATKLHNKRKIFIYIVDIFYFVENLKANKIGQYITTDNTILSNTHTHTKRRY